MISVSRANRSIDSSFKSKYKSSLDIFKFHLVFIITASLLDNKRSQDNILSIKIDSITEKVFKQAVSILKKAIKESDHKNVIDLSKSSKFDANIIDILSKEFP